MYNKLYFFPSSLSLPLFNLYFVVAVRCLSHASSRSSHTLMPVFYLLVIVAFMLSFLLFSVWFSRYFYIIFCLTFLSLFGVCLCWPVLSYLFCHYSLFNERCSFRHRVLATGIHIHCLSLSFVCIYPFVCLKDISSVPPHFSAFCSLCVRFLSSVFSLFFYNIALICCFSASPWFFCLLITVETLSWVSYLKCQLSLPCYFC